MNTFLKNKDFRWITISDLVSVFGDAIFYLAMITYASTFENSSLAISLVTISETIPDALSCLTGYWGDRTKNKIKADYLSAILRAVLYGIVAIIFYYMNGWSLLLLLLVINTISDIFGTYSDNLRFPEIYAIVPDNEFESSTGFSSALYNIFNIIGKLSGGFVFILLNYNYSSFALLNSFTFILCALCLIKVYKSVHLKMMKVEENETKDKVKFIDACKDIIKNKAVFNMILYFMVLNGLVATLLPIIYIDLANNKTSVNNYTIAISGINIVSIIGVILGNILSGTLLKKMSIKICIIFNCISILSLLFVMNKINIILLLVCIFILFFFQGIISVKFTSYLYSRQEYTGLGLSVGITNTLLTISIPVIIFIITGIGNAFNFNVSIYIIGLVTIIYMLTLKLNKGIK